MATIWQIEFFSRTIDGICLRSLDKILGEHEIFDLHSHKVITGRKSIEIPIPREIIIHIEEMAAHEKVTSLKSKNRTGVIYDNHWIIGVEYENESENYSEEYQEDKDYT